MYNEAIKLNPLDSDSYYNKGNQNKYNIGISLNKIKRYEEALQMYDKAIELNPKYNKLYYFFYKKGNKYYYDLGKVLDKLNRYRDASLMYDKTIEMNSYFSKAYRCKGAIYLFDIGMYDKAL